MASFALALLASSQARAGPPFLTDDPEPTDAGHWEIYAPLVDGAGIGDDYDGSVGAEFNYGAAPNLQLTVGVPLGFAHGASGLRFGLGDLEASAKYRFYHDEAAGISIAVFPGITIPTASRGFGNRKVTVLLPLWGQRDAGPWSIFGGGGYAINPGAGNRDYWTGGIAVTRAVSKRLVVGIEADRQGGDAIAGRATTDLGIGAIWQLKAPFRLLASGGPTLKDGHEPPGFHAFMALGIDF